MISRDLVYQMLTKEDEYARAWSKNGRKKDSRHSVEMGEAFTLMDWLVFVEKYLNEAKLAYANYCPDRGAIRIRLIKAASLLVSALECHGKEEDLGRLAGVSSSEFPILQGGLKTFEALINDDGVLAKQIGKLRSEEPLRKKNIPRTKRKKLKVKKI